MAKYELLTSARKFGMKNKSEYSIKKWFINRNPQRLKSQLSCLEKLKSIRAPEVIIQSRTKNINIIKEEIKTKSLPPIKGLSEFKDLIYDSVEIKTGKGGKKYFSFIVQERIINFFPHGKYGAFINEYRKQI